MTTYKSNLEVKFANRFPSAKYEVVRLPYVVTHNYVPDFQIGPNLFVETKGLFTSADRSKHLYIKAQHPHVKVLLVFQNPNLRLTRASKTTYAEWCVKHDVAWMHINDISTHTVETLLNKLEAKAP